MAKKPDPLPKHLSPHTRRWAASVLNEYELSPTQLELLTMAAEARDASEKARAVVAKDGAVFRDRFQQPKESPWAKLQRDYAAACSRLLREIGLAHDDTDDARPPRIGD
ncbi:MAG: hypothetical protein RIK87_00705 [Fuerstiella sp.]